jgi:uncharacterized protein
MYKRSIDLDEARSESLFLWGPRQTGKSTLLSMLFPESLRYDLLLSSEYQRLTRRPELLKENIMALSPEDLAKQQPVILDEVQKIPSLLDTVQWLMVNKGVRFILCGSSAKKLRRGHGNLLGGRALHCELHPLSFSEVPDFDLIKALNRGMLPRHYSSDAYPRRLQAYVGDYLKEEIAAEALTRNIQAFANFLDVAAISNGEIINFSNIARECGVSAPTVKEYYQILVDTLMGRFVPAFRKRAKRRVIETPRFYFFDVGVLNALAKRRGILPGGELFGKAFEHFIYQELTAWSDYRQAGVELAYWRTASGFEVDFVLNDRVALEVKASSNIQSHHLKGLRAIHDDFPALNRIMVSLDERPRMTEDRIRIMPWRIFLTELWEGDLLS